MNKLVVTSPTLTMKSTPTELEASELAEGVLFLKIGKFAQKNGVWEEKKSIYELTLAENVGKHFKL